MKIVISRLRRKNIIAVTTPGMNASKLVESMRQKYTSILENFNSGYEKPVVSEYLFGIIEEIKDDDGVKVLRTRDDYEDDRLTPYKVCALVTKNSLNELSEIYNTAKVDFMDIHARKDNTKNEDVKEHCNDAIALFEDELFPLINAKSKEVISDLASTFEEINELGRRLYQGTNQFDYAAKKGEQFVARLRQMAVRPEISIIDATMYLYNSILSGDGRSTYANTKKISRLRKSK